MKKIGVKFLCVVLTCSIMFSGMTFKAQAQWSMDFPGNIAGNVFGWVLDFIEKVIYAVVKKEVIDEVVTMVEDEIGGSEGTKFITDWRDALQTQPGEVTQVQIKNLFSTLGTSSSGYASTMLEEVKTAVLDESTPEVVNLSEYGVTDAADIFKNQTNMRAFMTAYGSPDKIGNRIDAAIYAQGKKIVFSEVNAKLAEAQAIANGGFYPSTSNGQVITPGSTIRDMMASANAMSFQTLANTDNIAEVVASLLSRVISGALDEGIGESKSNSQDTDSANSLPEDIKASFGSV